jgi:hypothetical protein
MIQRPVSVSDIEAGKALILSLLIMEKLSDLSYNVIVRTP